MVARMQVTLRPDEHRRAKAKAAAAGVSLAEYIRRLVAADLGDPQPSADVSALFVIGDSGGSNIARLKDGYVGDAVEAEHPRRRDLPE